jgi:hypothetical protein
LTSSPGEKISLLIGEPGKFLKVGYFQPMKEEGNIDDEVNLLQGL